jgi:low temperature requirement protein LtrA
VWHSIIGYLAVFFAVWWAWMNYTWFGSAFDNDDHLYRLALFVQIGGVVVLAAGVASAFDGNFAIVTIGYVIMRVAMVFQWWRVSKHPQGRPAAPRYALGIVVLQVGWVALLAVPTPAKWFGFAALVLGEFAVPLVAERDHPTAWHPGHIVERFGLLTIIVIGESITSAMVAIKAAVDTRQHIGTYITIAIGAVMTVAAMWWLYFGIDHERTLVTAHDSGKAQRRQAFVWAYGHLVVFASVAAVGASIAVATEAISARTAGEHETGAGLAHPGLVYSIPVAVYLVALWLLHRKSGASKGWTAYLVPATAMAIIPIGLIDHAVLVGGLVVTALVTALSTVPTGRDQLH